MILDNLVVFFPMFLWALGLPILDLQQEGWDGFSLSIARALLAGLTMLGLAYFSRPVFFRRKEVLTSFFLGIFGYGLASLLLVIGIGYAGAVTAAIIAVLVPVISALLDVIATRRMIDFRLFIAVILSLVGGLIATLNNQGDGIDTGMGRVVFVEFGGSVGALLAFFSQYARPGSPCWRIRIDDDRRECGFVAGNLHCRVFWL